MVSPVLQEPFYTAGFLVRDLGTISRDVVTLDNTAGALDLLVNAGTVFSFSNVAAAIVTATAGNTGNGTVGAVAANPVQVQLGTYVVTMLTATTFSVTAPDGDVLAPGATGAPYADSLGFLLSAGGTAFVPGDAFNIVVATGAPPVATPKTGGNTGNGTLTAIEAVQQATVLPGNYLVDFTAPTKFNVTAPDGRALLPGTVATAYEDEIAFTITAGGTAFAAGDRITIGFGAGSGYAVAYTGALPAAGVVYNRAYVPAGGTKMVTGIMRQAEVNAGELQFATGVTANGRATAMRQLKALGISAR